MAQHPATPEGLAARFRENVRALKTARRLTDAVMARAGGYTSRQVMNNRLSGRTLPDANDLSRIAAALRVDPHVLLLPTSDAIRWTEENPTYKPPRLRLMATDVEPTTRAKG